MHTHIPPATRRDALSVLESVFGYSAFRGQQADIVAHIIAGGNAFVLMPTGGGKSLCYQVPALVRDGVTVVISPLIALMQDQVDALKRRGVRAELLNSTLTHDAAARIERSVRGGETKLLYISPERLATARCVRLLEQSDVALFAVDEAHCISEWGHDFRPEYLKLTVIAERFPAVPRIALTATADAHTRAEIVERLALDGARTFISSFDRPNIRYAIADKRNERKQLLRFIRRHTGACGVVYCQSRDKVDEIAAFLDASGVDALPYHAGLSAREREDNQAWFIAKRGIVMVATIAFGMGIDKPDVRFVAHLDIPKSIEGYYQETGRAGRDGLPSDALLLYDARDAAPLLERIKASSATEHHRRIQTLKLRAMVALCETRFCRRRHLLAYFGERSRACGKCDTCLSLPDKQRSRVRGAKKPVRRSRRLDAAGESLFARLFAWRADIAQREQLPAHVVFHDATLLEIARRRPRWRWTLGRIPGVSPAKLVVYGRDVLRVISAFEKEIEREAEHVQQAGSTI